MLLTASGAAQAAGYLRQSLENRDFRADLGRNCLIGPRTADHNGPHLPLRTPCLAFSIPNRCPGCGGMAAAARRGACLWKSFLKNAKPREPNPSDCVSAGSTRGAAPPYPPNSRPANDPRPRSGVFFCGLGAFLRYRARGSLPRATVGLSRFHRNRRHNFCATLPRSDHQRHFRELCACPRPVG